MFRLSRRAMFGIVSVLLAGAVGVLSAQAGRAGQPPARPAGDELLAELRALRAELNEAAGASVRTQLLVARLQLQEQRFNQIARQLTEVRDRIAESEQGRAMIMTQLKSFGDMSSDDVPKAFAPLKAMIDQGVQREQELRAQEAALDSQLAAEQARWTEFNDRLDVVEKELPVRKPR